MPGLGRGPHSGGPRSRGLTLASPAADAGVAGPRRRIRGEGSEARRGQARRVWFQHQWEHGALFSEIANIPPNSSLHLLSDWFPNVPHIVVRFYVSCRPPPPPPPPPPCLVLLLLQTSSASAGWQCPRRTSTARVAWQCSPPPDLNRELRLAVFPAGPQPRVKRYAR